ncbi:unnamed protein product [Prunus armeniaca]|uniref:Uncharacterized protein n=1 Tax=Prunus armeniaca TaxID=36596 RepID=A0A6J5XR13_PRUAR|nr:unnamed protein product [Prunus armeniaca]
MSQESSHNEPVTPAAPIKGRKKSNRLTNIETYLKEMKKDINELRDQNKEGGGGAEKTYTGRQRRLEEWRQEHGDSQQGGPQCRGKLQHEGQNDEEGESRPRSPNGTDRVKLQTFEPSLCGSFSGFSCMPTESQREYLDLRDLLEAKKAQYIRPHNRNREVDRDREVNHGRDREVDRDGEVDQSEVRPNRDEQAGESRIWRP